MTAFFIGLTVLAAFVALWVTLVRPWLRTKSWAARFFAWIEPVEIALWRKSETILWARLKMVVGVLLTVLTQIGTLDITPIMPLVPDAYEDLFRTIFGLLPLIITLMGWIDEQLRKDTTKPIEVVAAPEAVKAALPEVVAAEVANIQAVAAIDVAKAEGTS